MLCAADFATAGQLVAHITSVHCGMVEYRKRLFFLQAAFDGVKAISPQQWRHVIEGFTEHLISGSSEWPACVVKPRGASLSLPDVGGGEACAPAELPEAQGSPVVESPSLPQYPPEPCEAIRRGGGHARCEESGDRGGGGLGGASARAYGEQEGVLPRCAAPSLPEVGVGEACQPAELPVPQGPPVVKHPSLPEYPPEPCEPRKEGGGHAACKESGDGGGDGLGGAGAGAHGDQTSGRLRPGMIEGAEGREANGGAVEKGAVVVASEEVMDGEAGRKAGELGAPDRWWRESNGGESAGAGAVRLEVLGDEGAPRRQALRSRVACSVCARLDWGGTREDVYLWQQPEGCGRRSCISDEMPRAPRGKGGVAGEGGTHGGGEGDGGSVQRVAREVVADLLSPERYQKRWAFKLEGAGRIGGIPLAELEASAVRDPGPGGRLWLLHRRNFRMVKNSEGQEVADPSQAVPCCSDCRAALSAARPRMPKYALANDLWIGKLPSCLEKLSSGAWLLLPLCRALVRRYNCMTGGGGVGSH